MYRYLFFIQENNNFPLLPKIYYNAESQDFVDILIIHQLVQHRIRHESNIQSNSEHYIDKYIYIYEYPSSNLLKG